MSKSLLRAVEILDCFIEETEMTLNDLVDKTGMSKTTVFRLTSSLIEAGLLIKEKKSSHHVVFRLSLKFLTYGRKVNESLSYREVTLPYMKELNKKINELVHLTVIEGNQAVYVETFNSTKSLRIVVKTGKRVPLYSGSAPKLLLAHFSPNDLEHYFETVQLKPITENTIIEKNQLKKELTKIKDNGYSISESEYFPNTFGCSFPIYNYEGNLVAAIGVSLPMQDHSPEKEEQILHELKKTAAKICAELGFVE